MILKRIFLFLLVFCLFLTNACEKKILENVAVIEIDDISVPCPVGIHYITFINSKIGFAASKKSNMIFRTSNGGKSWSKTSIGENEGCGGLAFFDEKNGLCLMEGKLFATNDGAKNWKQRTNVFGDCLVKTKDGILGLVKAGIFTSEVMKSTNRGETFYSLGELWIEGIDEIYPILEESMLFLTRDDLNSNDKLLGYDLESEEKIYLKYDNIGGFNYPTDVYFTNHKEQIGYSTSWTGHIMSNSMGDKTFEEIRSVTIRYILIHQ